MTGSDSQLQIIILAAGLSTRMGQDNKLLLPYCGKPIIRQVVETLIHAQIGMVNVVTGFEADKVGETLDGLDINLLHNADFEQGQMSSVKRAYQEIQNLNADVMIALGDMPKISKTEYQQIAKAFQKHDRQKIIIPYFGKQRGNPIIMPAKFNAEIAEGSMNAGCRRLTTKKSADVVKLLVASATYIADIDTPDDYADVTTTTAQYTFPICC